MLTPADVALVRGIIGTWGAALSDQVLMGDTALEMSWLQVLDMYREAGEETDPVKVNTITRAQALFLAADAALAAPAIQSSRLGNQTMTFETGGAARVAARWRAQAQSLLRDLYGAKGIGAGMFGIARGKRGE